MRRYLQGTLDFACAVYAVINALSVMYALDLAGARHIFKETHVSLAGEPALWDDYLGNNTDHYWLVRHMLRRWCSGGPYALRLAQPFSDCLLPTDKDLDFTGVERHLPERETPAGPSSLAAAEKEARSVWRELDAWLGAGNRSPGTGGTGGTGGAGVFPRAALLRFHRFVPGLRQPVVSHWTTGKRLERSVLQLHDASSESGALLALERSALMPSHNGRALVRVVPESLLLLEAKSVARQGF